MQQLATLDLEHAIPDIDYGVSGIVEKIIRDGDPEKRRPVNMLIRIEENGRRIKCCSWEYTKSSDFSALVESRNVCNFVIRGYLYKDSLEFKVVSFDKTDEISKLPDDIEDVSQENDQVKQLIEATASQVANEKFKELLNSLILNNPNFFIWKAARTNHHAFEGGLAIHSYNVCADAITLANQYNGIRGLTVDYDLLITGALLHDIGKLREYNQNGDFTFDGNLMSHLVSGIEIINDACTSLGIDKYSEDIKKLKHIIVAHHGKLEFGSPNTPVLLEAYLVHYADYSDARIETIIETTSLLNEGELSSQMKSVDNGKIYKLF